MYFLLIWLAVAKTKLFKILDADISDKQTKVCYHSLTVKHYSDLMVSKRPQDVEKTTIRNLRRSARLNLELPLDASQSKSRKRNREIENPFDNTRDSSARKRRKTPTVLPVEAPADQASSHCSSEPSVDGIEYWNSEYIWPKDYFEPVIMNSLLARKISTASLRRKRSDLSSDTSATPSN